MPKTVREVVAVFDHVNSLDNAVSALQNHGFDESAFSLLATENVVEEKLGRRYRRVKEVEDNPRIPREFFFSRASRLAREYLPAPLLASAGALLLAVTGSTLPVLIAAGSGALFGAALGVLMHQHDAMRVQEQLARGGLLLWVQVRNAQQEETARKVLREHSAHDVHAHAIAA